MRYASEAQAFFEALLREYRTELADQQKELSLLPAGQLTKRSERGNLCYVQLISDDSEGGRQRRIGITQRQDLIAGLARKRYLQISTAALQENIALLEKFMKRHKTLTPDEILQRLPAAYKSLPETIFFPERKSDAAWGNEVFQQSTHKAEERRHTTASGLKVRSKSEVIIADRLDFYRIPFRYEALLYIENETFSPDFTIQAGKRFYWQHCGMVSDSRYMKEHKWKLSLYERAGIVPWKNLIVTYDDEYGNIDARIIEAEIKNKLL